MCFTFDNLLRRLVQNPEKVIEPYVHSGDTVLDVGPGMGYFSIPLAKIVGERGRVFAADVQQEMLNALQKRARRAGVDQRITLHLCKEDSLGLNIKFDTFDGAKPRFLNRGKKRHSVSTLSIPRASDRGVEWVDFALAFWMVHEVPEQESFFKEIRSLLKPDGKFLMSEPKIHVTKIKFDETVEKAIRAGFTLKGYPSISLSRSALFSI
jgi:ubiquinone/menaquinone biosynthesis C-methylase UbiE